MKKELRIVLRFVFGLALVFPFSAYFQVEDFPLGALIVGYPILVFCGIMFGMLPGALFALGYIPFGRKLKEWRHLATFAILLGLALGYFLWFEWMFNKSKIHLFILGPVAAGAVCAFASFYSEWGNEEQNERAA